MPNALEVRRWAWSAARMALVIVTLATAAAAPGRADFVTGISFLPEKPTVPSLVPYLDIVKLLDANLGAAQQLNIYNNLCKGAGLFDVASQLTMPYVIGAGQDDPTKNTIDVESTTNVIPPGRLSISPIGDDKNFYAGYGEYITKRLQNAATIPTAEGLHDTATTFVFADRSTKDVLNPTLVSGNNANTNLAINGGAKSSVALIFSGNATDLPQEVPLETYRALAQAAYGFTNKGNALLLYDHNLPASDDFEGTKISGEGTLANFKTALGTLKAIVNAAPNQAVVNIFLDGHGYRAAVEDPRDQGAAPNAPKDGAVVSGGNPASETIQLNTDATFWHDLKVGLLPTGDNDFRANPPTFFLAVSEANVSGSFAIYIGGIDLGDFVLGPTSTGGLLEVELPDSLVLALIAEDDVATEIPISFDFSSSSDWFRIATEDDLLLDPSYQEDTYGLGIATVVADQEVVPEPTALVLIATGAPALLLKRLARTRPRGRVV